MTSCSECRFANRDSAELSSLFGFLIDFQALRTDLSGNPTFRELLGRVREGLLDIQDNRAIPFDKVVELLRPRRDPSRAPLFQTMLIWKDRGVQMQFMELEGLTVSHLAVHTGAAKYDLTLYLTDAGDEIWLEVEYCTDLFSADMIGRLVGHFQTLLDGIVVNPEERLDVAAAVNLRRMRASVGGVERYRGGLPEEYLPARAVRGASRADP